MDYQSIIKSLRRKASIGLWTSLAFIAVAALFFMLAPVHFRSYTEHTTFVLLIAICALTVLAVSGALLIIRKRIPALRQTEGLATKLQTYSRHISRLYLGMMVVVGLQCVLSILADQSAMLMLSLVSVLMLFMSYPNMYKMKSDLGLLDDEMQTLFGEQYTASQSNEQ